LKIASLDTQDLKPSAWTFLTWLALFTLLPFCIILTMSLTTRGEYGTLTWVPTLTNYARCFQVIYAKVLGKTVFLAWG